MIYPVENLEWLVTFLWEHRAIPTIPKALWPDPSVWRAICGHLDAIYWPGVRGGTGPTAPNWRMAWVLLASGSTVRLLGGPITDEPLFAKQIPNGDTGRFRNVIGTAVGTTVLYDVTRYGQAPYGLSHERGHALAALYPTLIDGFGVEPWAEAFARVTNGAAWSSEEETKVRRALSSRGLV